MIRYRFNEEEYEIEATVDGLYHLNTLHHRHAMDRYTKRPGYFVQRNNSPWKGMYKASSNRYEGGGTHGPADMAMSYLQWLGAEEFQFEGRKIKVLKAKRAEEAFGEKLIDAMSKVYTVIPQFKVLGGKYIIDFYIPETRQAIEYDEPANHVYKAEYAEYDVRRQREIEKALGCSFIRIPH